MMKLAYLKASDARELDDNPTVLAVGGVRRSKVDRTERTVTLSMKHTVEHNYHRKKYIGDTYHSYAVTLTEEELRAALAHLQLSDSLAAAQES